ncbi:hypothetical protein [Algivirga pacifica]|uniref:Gliding motility protein GldN n=1 Tax=Algivirga pacifica TaxID=1162670 RepID=A0ABP9D813_9BACT
MKKIFLTLICSWALIPAIAQNYAPGEEEEPVHSVYEYPKKYEVMSKRTVWYEVDLEQRINRPFHNTEFYIADAIIRRALISVLMPYDPEDPTRKMDNFREVYEKATAVDEQLPEVGGGMFWGPDLMSEGSGMAEATEGAGDDFRDDMFHYLQAEVDLIYDKTRSIWIRDIKRITVLYEKSDGDDAGKTKRPLATFNYKDFKYLFKDINRDNSAEQKAYWVNINNRAEDRSIMDAFELMLFSGKMIKYNNHDDALISQILEDELERSEIERNKVRAGEAPRYKLKKAIDYEYGLLEENDDLYSY